MQTKTKVDGITSSKWTATYEGIPCRLSFSSLQANQKGDADKVSQTTKLFVAPSVEVPDGCRIKVKRSTGDVFTFERSGLPAVYLTHQEIVLAPLEVYA